MNATKLQNPSETVHAGSPRSLVGVSAVIVLMLTVLTIWLARPGETTRPETARTETTAPMTTAPVTEVGLQVPTKGPIVRGGGYVVMPPRAAAATKSTANEASSAGTGIVPSKACPERLAVKGFC
ncbi:MAG: hypothetical protein ACXWW9_03555 [Actinomycetota bacterium]